MDGEAVVVYISENCPSCNFLLAQLDKWNVSYSVKNVSTHIENKEELQNKGIYGTPATFIGNDPEAMLGLQLNNLKNRLGILSPN